MQIKIETVPDDHAGKVDHSGAGENSSTLTLDPPEKHTPEDPMLMSTGTLDSLPQPTPESQEAYAAQRCQSWLGNTLSSVQSGAQRAVHPSTRAFYLALLAVITVLVFHTLVPLVSHTLMPVLKVAACVSPFGDAFTFCGGPSDVVVMHDYAALAQVHTMALSHLYESAAVVWKHSDDLAHTARILKENAYYVEDSTLASKEIISRELQKVDKETRDAADSLYKLSAGAVGTITRTQFSFEKLLNVLYEVQVSVSQDSSVSNIRAIELKLQQTFVRAAQEASEDLHALQNVTYFTLGDLKVIEEHLNALDVAARREERGLQKMIKEDAVTGWFRDLAREARLEEHLENAVLLESIHNGVQGAKAAVLDGMRSVKWMLSEMEYLGGLPMKRLLLNGTALNELIGDLEGYKMANVDAAQKYDEERAEIRRDKFARINVRERVGAAGFDDA